MLHNHTDLKQPKIDLILKGLHMALSNNYFCYQGEYFNQIKGVSMGGDICSQHS